MATVRALKADDLDEAIRMRTALWPHAAEDHPVELRRYLAGEPMLDSEYQREFPMAVLVAERAEGGLCGFIEVGIRSVAEGCYEGNPVGYVEGWYVDSDMRRKDIGRALIVAAEKWAVGQGCSEMASDSSLTNESSIQAHEALGFGEVERAVHFRKSLKG